MSEPGSTVTGMKNSSASRRQGSFVCVACGWTTAKWVGRCGECQQWGTVEERGAAGGAPRTTAGRVATAALPITEVDITHAQARSTGIGELDRVLGGGIVPGGVVLLAGEPGVGKSTLLLTVAAHFAGAVSPGKVLYITGEESASQVRLRAERISALRDKLLLAAETDLATVLGHIAQQAPQLVIVDSVQTIASAAVDGSAGGVSQVREVTGALIAAAKAANIPIILVGHVTKDGSVAGPRILEHLVDVVCNFEGDRASSLRLLRAIKNRYGPTDEVGCFALAESGIIEVPDPSGLFISQSAARVPGTAISVTVEGNRALGLEIQALAAPSVLSNPRRTTSGVDSSRLAMIIAVLQRRLGVQLGNSDVYVSTVGGAKVVDPAADVAIAVALLSSVLDGPPHPQVAVLGEIGLSGELRAITGYQRRIAEAARLGRTKIVAPAGAAKDVQLPKGVELVEALDLHEALNAAVPKYRKK